VTLHRRYPVARPETGLPDPKTVTTKRLTLRRFRAEDASAFHEILSDAQAMRYWSTLPHASLAETERWIASTIAAVGSGKADEFVVIHDGKIVGKAGLWAGNELGMIFAPGVWGRGFASEAAAAVIARAFARGLKSIRADVDPRNVQSLRLLRKLGSVETGSAQRTLRIGDEWMDSIYLELRPA
jgi:RimJ/RimL family protein N-acetyltransferase